MEFKTVEIEVTTDPSYWLQEATSTNETSTQCFKGTKGFEPKLIVDNLSSTAEIILLEP